MLRGTAKRASSEVKLFRLLARWRWLVWLAVWERGKSWLHVEVGGSQRHGSSQAIKTKQFGRFHQHDKLCRRGLASPNGSSGLTWKKAAEILGTMLVHLPIADWPRVCALGLGGSTLVETHGRKASPITPFPRTQCTGHHWVRVGPPPHCDITAASLACVLPCCPSQINRSACGLRSDSSSTQRTNRFTRSTHPIYESIIQSLSSSQVLLSL